MMLKPIHIRSRLTGTVQCRARSGYNTRPTLIKPNRSPAKTVRGNAISNDVVEVSYFVGKYVMLFTFFYSSLNYMFYRKEREEQEKYDKED